MRELRAGGVVGERARVGAKPAAAQTLARDARRRVRSSSSSCSSSSAADCAVNPGDGFGRRRPGSSGCFGDVDERRRNAFADFLEHGFAGGRVTGVGLLRQCKEERLIQQEILFLQCKEERHNQHNQHIMEMKKEETESTRKTL